ncbi:C13 family peptidase [Sphingomonas lenta]|uniref:Peptidase C13 n=1 Tax=Sphingomonas lenta TaxID=1141887 RepID=A0A2A2SG13_9SPHN|nr:C13 family peptidase [Sphingomonas lenta]PAX08196.1 peptidase C13 [Sphingomonas lenta]
MNRFLKPLVALLAFTPAAAAQQQPYQPPQHNQPAPLIGTASQQEVARLAELGVQIERDRTARDMLAEHRRLATALANLQPQRRGKVDAYVVSVALDSDPVFGREAREAGRVLARRYKADGRTIVLAGTDGSRPSDLPMGSPQTLAAALARVAELMDAREDVLVLYTTSHGAPLGLVYNDGDQGFGAIAPAKLWRTLRELGIENRLLFISACYSGQFVPMMMADRTAIVTASAADKTSFGCQADNDWTFFGDAVINQALRKPQPLGRAVDEARGLIARWEREGRLDASDPQVSIGRGAGRWLAALERDLPPASATVGRSPATVLRASR